jgi:hypothetical protein
VKPTIFPEALKMEAAEMGERLIASTTHSWASTGLQNSMTPMSNVNVYFIFMHLKKQKY